MTTNDEEKFFHIDVSPVGGSVSIFSHEREFNLTLEELESRFLAPYNEGRPIVVDGRTIPMNGSFRVRIFETQDTIEREAEIYDDPTVDVTSEYINAPPGSRSRQDTSENQQTKAVSSLRVFISHSSTDSSVARFLVDLLRKALGLKSDEIRCTSLDGYRMQAGVAMDERLRVEVHETELLIGLISPDSLQSAYVMFELGARWGANKPMIPLLSSGATPALLGGPLAGIHSLDASEAGQVHQLLEDAASHLQLTLDKPSSYTAEVTQLVQAASQPTSVPQFRPANDPAPRLSPDAKSLLLEASLDENRIVLLARTMGGTAIQTNGKGFTEMGNARSEARWEQALEELHRNGYVKDRVGKGEAFEVTHHGYQTADALGGVELASEGPDTP